MLAMMGVGGRVWTTPVAAHEQEEEDNRDDRRTDKERGQGKRARRGDKADQCADEADDRAENGDEKSDYERPDAREAGRDRLEGGQVVLLIGEDRKRPARNQNQNEYRPENSPVTNAALRFDGDFSLFHIKAPSPVSAPAQRRRVFLMKVISRERAGWARRFIAKLVRIALFAPQLTEQAPALAPAALDRSLQEIARSAGFC